MGRHTARPSSNVGTVRGSHKEVQQCHVIADKGRTSLDNPTNKAQPQPSPAIIRNNTGATGAGGRETDRAPACNHRSVTCGQPYSAWRWPRPSVSAWQPLLWHTA